MTDKNEEKEILVQFIQRNLNLILSPGVEMHEKVAALDTLVVFLSEILKKQKVKK